MSWRHALVSVLLIAGCQAADESPAPAPVASPVVDLAGSWVATLEHNGTTERFGLDLEPNEEGTVVRALVTIPAIEMWRYPVGTASLSGDTLQIGGAELAYDAGTPRLLGTVPSGFAPFQTIELDLRRGDPLEPPPPPTALPAPELAWTFETGGPIWAGVTIANGAVYVGSDDGFVYGLSTSGEEHWRFETGAAVRADPVVYGDSVLIHSDDGYLYRVSDSSGRLDWRTKLGDQPIERLAYGAEGFRYDHYASAPAVRNQRIYVGHERDIFAVGLLSGEVEWRRELPDTTTSTPAVAADRVLVGSFDGSVYALDAASGAIDWSHDTGAAVPSSVAVHGELLIAGSRSYDLVALTVYDGAPAWTYYNWFSWIESSPAIHGGTVYVGSSDSQWLHAIDAATGELSWRFDTNGSAWSRPAVSEDVVVVGAVGVAGYLVDHRGGLFAVDRTSGEGLWHLPSEQPDGAAIWGFGASPAVGEGLVIAGGLDGRVIALR